VVEECSITVKEINTDPKFVIYPNPAKNTISISCKNEIVINEVSIYNQLGQSILHRKVSKNKVDISTFEQGLYIIELITDNVKSRQKLIIK